MGAISPIIGEERAAVVSGVVQASAGIGDALMSPAIQILTDNYGISFSLPVFSVPILLTIPAVIWLGASKKRQDRQSSAQVKVPEQKEKLSKILGTAIHDPAYWCLLVGFSTCGFHMAIIETHLFSQYVSCGIPSGIASLTLTVYGIMTMIGAVISGFLGQKFKMKTVLTGIYGFRVLIGLCFLFFAKTIPFAFIATGFLGLTGDSTVPPTTGIISKKVGVAKMAVVYGSIFIGHQVGAFASAWLGGVLVHTALGYSALWIVDLCLSLIAAVFSYRIKE